MINLGGILNNIIDLRPKFYAIRICECMKKGDEGQIIHLLEIAPPDILAGIYHEIESMTGKRLLSLCS
mgnify:CR=1 FL=1